MTQYTEFDDEIDDDESYENDDEFYEDDDEPLFRCNYCDAPVDFFDLDTMTCSVCNHDPN